MNRGLAHDIALLLLLKTAALLLLWLLFFSPSHRSRIDGSAASEHLGFPLEQHSPIHQQRLHGCGDER